MKKYRTGQYVTANRLDSQLKLKNAWIVFLFACRYKQHTFSACRLVADVDCNHYYLESQTDELVILGNNLAGTCPKRRDG